MNGIAQKLDPWQGAPVQCIAYPRTPSFVTALQGVLDDKVTLVEGIDAQRDQVVLVDCREIVQGMIVARQRFSVQPLVGVVDQVDTTTVIQLLAAGADAVIALDE